MPDASASAVAEADAWITFFFFFTEPPVLTHAHVRAHARSLCLQCQNILLRANSGAQTQPSRIHTLLTAQAQDSTLWCDDSRLHGNTP